VQKGASIVNYLKATKLLRENERVIGVEAIDQLSRASVQIRGKSVVNATGPWVDHVLGTFNGKRPQLGVQLAKAVNIATRPLFKRFAVGLSGVNVNQGNGSENDDRLFFITPWRNQSLIGTTYNIFDAHPDSLKIKESDVQELLESFNSIYPPANLSLDDVKFVYCGLVPISDVNIEKSEFKRAGHFRIHDHQQDGYPGLISVLGVKYTTARDVAVKVLDHVCKILGLDLSPSNSKKVALYGGDIEHFDSFLETEINKKSNGLRSHNIRSLIYNYGTAYQEILRYMDTSGENGEPVIEEQAILKAQISYSVHNEMALKLSDIIFRRTEIGTGGQPSEDILDFCAAVMSGHMGWDAVQIQEEIQAVKEAYSFKPSIQ
jgi:glycerol-3-phosphate dehydrogenase